jgi:pimeloyl-ACP methyl ester carboxylesterase
MKTAVILAGRHTITDAMYQPIVSEFKACGWEQVHFYEPDWSVTNVVKLVDDFLAKLPQNSAPLTVLGFSLGAMIALIAANKISVENLILCSPSGYFAEYSQLLTNEDREWANKNLEDFRDFSASTIIDRAKVHHGVVLAGEVELREWPGFRQWIADLKSQTAWQYIELPGTGHEIEAPMYQQAIKKVINDTV